METVWEPCKGGPWPDFPPVHPGRLSGQRPWVLQGLCASSGPCTLHGSRGKFFPSLLGLPHVPGDVCPEAIIKDVEGRAALGPPPPPPQKIVLHTARGLPGPSFSQPDRPQKQKQACLGTNGQLFCKESSSCPPCKQTTECFVQPCLLDDRDDL